MVLKGKIMCKTIGDEVCNLRAADGNRWSWQTVSVLYRYSSQPISPRSLHECPFLHYIPAMGYFSRLCTTLHLSPCSSDLQIVSLVGYNSALTQLHFVTLTFYSYYLLYCLYVQDHSSDWLFPEGLDSQYHGSISPFAFAYVFSGGLK